MGNINRILTLIFMMLPMLLAQTLSAQHCHRCDRNSFALWTDVGYSSIMNHSPETQALGGFGGAIGIGYEFIARRGFLLRTGLELSLYNSLMRRSDTLHVVPMRDTQDRLFEGRFHFENIHSRQQIANVGPSLMVGMQSANNFYCLVGGKVKFNIHGAERTRTDVTKTAFYDFLVGDNHDGILSNMPNHGLTTERRFHDSPLRINPLFIGSIESGYVFYLGGSRFTRNPRNPGNTRMRLSVFCDYGFSPVSASATNYDLIINKSHTSQYIPHITGFLHHDVRSNFFNTLFAGVRLTILFGIPPKFPCKWEM